MGRRIQIGALLWSAMEDGGLRIISRGVLVSITSLLLGCGGGTGSDSAGSGQDSGINGEQVAEQSTPDSTWDHFEWGEADWK